MEAKMEKVNLLLVDDEPEILDMWRVHFEEDRFNIFEATTGEEALQLTDKLKDWRHQMLIVLLDVKMPGLNGLEVLESIKRLAPLAKIFIITGNVTDDEIPDTAYFTGKLGGDGFYEKSKINFDALKEQIDQFISGEIEKQARVENIQDALNQLGTRADLELPYKIK